MNATRQVPKTVRLREILAVRARNFLSSNFLSYSLKSLS